MNKIKIALIFILIAFIGVYLYSNQILIKYIFSTSRNIGKEEITNIYTNGKLNKNIKLYSVNSYYNGEPANYDILFFYNLISRNIIIIDYNHNFIGVPISTNEKDYKVIMGNLFQSDIGSKFIPINDGIKGFNFDSELIFTDKTIKFNLPSNIYEIDSIRIEK